MGLSGWLRLVGITLACVVLAASCVALALAWLRFTLHARVSFGSGHTTVEAAVRVSFAGWSRRFAYHLRRSAVIGEALAILARADSPGSGLDVRSRAELLQVGWGFARHAARSGGLRSAELKLWLGTGDAATTAIAAGLANGFLGALAAAWSTSVTFPQRILAQCTPVWRESPVWRVELDCILAPTLSQAIHAAWRAYGLVRARKSSGPATAPAEQEKGRRYARTSHPGIDEDRDVHHQGDG